MGCCYEAESRIVVAISILSRSKTRRQWVHTVVGNLASAFHFGIPKVKKALAVSFAAADQFHTQLAQIQAHPCPFHLQDQAKAGRVTSADRDPIVVPFLCPLGLSSTSGRSSQLHSGTIHVLIAYARHSYFLTLQHDNTLVKMTCFPLTGVYYGLSIVRQLLASRRTTNDGISWHNKTRRCCLHLRCHIVKSSNCLVPQHSGTS